MHGHVIVKESVQVPTLLFFFSFFLNNFFPCNYLTLCGICAMTSTRRKKEKKKNTHPLTCLDIRRMLSITSTGNVIVCLKGGGAVGGGRVVMFIQSVSYVAWCDRHLRGFCKNKMGQADGKKETNHFYMILSIFQASCLNVRKPRVWIKKTRKR